MSQPKRVVDPQRTQAQREIAAVEAALRAGYPPVTPQGQTKIKSAIRVAAEACKQSQVAFWRRVGTPGTPGRWAKEFALAPDWSLYQAPDEPVPVIAKLGGSAADRRLIALQDEVRRLTAALSEAHRKALDDEAILQILGVFQDCPASPPPWMAAPPLRPKGKPTAEVPVVIFADWHIGEVVSAAEVNGVNAYDLTIAGQRVERLVDGIENLCFNHHSGNYPGIVVNLLGDFVSGGLHPELAKTDAEEVVPASLRALDLLIAALTRLAGRFGCVYCPCAAGNHGRNTLKPEFKRYVYKNFDWLIYQLLRRHFAGDARIVFDVRPANEVYYRVFGQRYLGVHGDMLGVKGGDGIIGAIGPIMRGEVKTSRQSASIGREYDVVVMGHWHQPLRLPRAIVSNTLKGFDEFARLQLRAPPTDPSQPLWFVHPGRGITAYWEVYVGEPRRAAVNDWVSFAREAA